MNNEHLYISPKGVLQLIFGTVLFPDLQEIKAYYTCKNKLDKIVELLALRKYGKSKKEIFKKMIYPLTKICVLSISKEIFLSHL